MDRRERARRFFALAASVTERTNAPSAGVPAPLLASFAEKVRTRAADISDEDVAALRDAGVSEDAIFEITATTALGASAKRLEIALRALGRGR